MNPNLMQYIEYGQPQGSGPRKYQGPVATGYDAKRQESPKWHAEHKAIEAYLSDLPAGATVVDVPVGTGRFIPLYEDMKLKWRGFDVSADMLGEAARKVTIPDLNLCLEQRPVWDLPLADKSVDAVVMCRLTRWLTPAERTAAMRELTRVARDAVIFTARVADHPHAYPYEAIKADLGEDWAIRDDVSADGPNYCVIRAVPVT